MQNLKSKFIFLFCLFGALQICYAQEESIYDAQGKRNPFIPLITSDGRILKTKQAETDKTLLLEGIIYDDKGLSYAIVNGQVLVPGDQISDYRLLKVEHNKVIFVKDDEPLELELEGGEP